MIRKNWLLTWALLCLSSLSYASDKFDRPIISEWNNPAPRFADLQIDIEQLQQLIGDGQLVVAHQPQDIELWTDATDKKQTSGVKTYQDARFVSAMAIVNQPLAQTRQLVADIDSYPSFMPQVDEAKVLQKQGKQSLTLINQVYKLFVLSLDTPFVMQYREEDNGDLSALLRQGDVGAGVTRWEFIPVNEKQTLMVSTTWLDMDSARFMLRTLIKAQPDIKPTMPVAGAAMVIQQFKDHIDPAKRKTASGQAPRYIENAETMQLLDQLTQLGTVMQVHETETLTVDGKNKELLYVSSIGRLPTGVETARQLSTDFDRLNEYFMQVQSVDVNEQNEKQGDMFWKLKFDLEVIGIKVDMNMQYQWLNDNQLLLVDHGGDIAPIRGAVEWTGSPSKPNETLYIFTNSTQISDDASWSLKMANKLPNTNLLSGLFFGMLMVEKQQDWMPIALAEENPVAPNSINH